MSSYSKGIKMRAICWALAAALILVQPARGTPDEALAEAVITPAVIPIGAQIWLETVTDISSKNAAKGDLVDLVVAEDIRVGHKNALPKGTLVVGQLTDARTEGMLGHGGSLVLSPLYVRWQQTTYRLSGKMGCHHVWRTRFRISGHWHDWRIDWPLAHQTHRNKRPPPQRHTHPRDTPQHNSHGGRSRCAVDISLAALDKFFGQRLRR
jgi:hypothetical protein